MLNYSVAELRVKEFPMTGSGKIQKFKLKDLSLELCKQQGIEII